MTPFFIFFLAAKLIWLKRGVVHYNATIVYALLLAIWWLVPILWLNREFFFIFLKDWITILAQFFILLVLYNSVENIESKSIIYKTLDAFCFYTTLSIILYLSGAVNVEFKSLLGLIIPESLVNNSSFFDNIIHRDFGSYYERSWGFSYIRASGLALKYTGLSLQSIFLVVYTYIRLRATKGKWAPLHLFNFLGMLAAFVFSQSRITYIVIFFLIAFLFLHRCRSFLKVSNGIMTLYMLPVLIVMGVFFYDSFEQIFQKFFVEWRPGSIVVRLKIYFETFRLLGEHLIAGWGVPVRIPNTPSQYSAGTHSSYLLMLFQHGIVGLILYLLFLTSIWRILLNKLKAEKSDFLFLMSYSFIAFNIREIFDSWWWDQSVTLTVWLFLGIFVSKNYESET